jgi:hypothetical protein
VSSEGFHITNPRDGNRDLQITYLTREGRRKKLKTLRPGETLHCEKREVTVTEVRRPPRLLLRDGELVPDTMRRERRNRAEP